MEHPVKVVKVMQNPVILEQISKKMPTKVLRSLRTTCALWNHTFVPSLRDRQDFVKLTCADSRLCRKHAEPAMEMEYLAELFMDTSSNTGIPIGKFHLLDLQAAGPGQLNEFFNICGSIVSHIDLDLGTLMSRKPTVVEVVTVMRRIVFELAPNLRDFRFSIVGGSEYFAADPGPASQRRPRDDAPAVPRELPCLRRIDINIGYHTEPVHPAVEIFLADIFRYCIGLESLSLSNAGGIRNIVALSALRNHGLRPCLSKLKSLKIYKLGASELKIMTDLAGRREHPLRLCSFETSIEYINQKTHLTLNQMLFKFLKLQSATLRKFSLLFGPGIIGDVRSIIPLTTRVELPVLGTVQTFQLGCHGLDPQHQQLLASPLEVIFPSLVRFNYANNFFDGTEDGMRGIEHRGSTLNELTLDINYVRGGDAFVQTYGSRFLFQALTRLELQITETRCVELLLQIFSGMPNLEVLVIIGTGSRTGHNYRDTAPVLELDSLLTGVPAHALGELQRVLDTEDLLTLEKLRAALQEHKTEPSIQDLRSLKKFVMDVSTCHYRITDIGGYFGAAGACEALQEIAIKDSMITEAFKRSEAAFREMLFQFTANPRARAPVSTGNLVSDRCRSSLSDIFGLGRVVILF